MAMIIIIIFVLIIFYFPILWVWKRYVKKRLSLLLSGILKYVHYLAVISIIVYFIVEKYTPFSYITDAVIVFSGILFLATGIIIYSVSDKKIFNKIESLYFIVFTYLPVSVFILFFLPKSLIECLFDLDDHSVPQVIYTDSKLRIEADFDIYKWTPNLQIYRKVLLFKKKLVDTDIMALDVSEIKVSYDPDSTRIIIYKTFDPNFSRTDTVSIAKDQR